MVDFRYNPHQSPYVWCQHCGKLVAADHTVKVMKTAFKVETSGVFPIGMCDQHADRKERPLQRLA